MPKDTLQHHNRIEVKHLINFDSKSVDLTTKLDGEVFRLTATTKESECYWDIAMNIRDYFSKIGLVSVNAFLYSPCGCVFMVNVYGRSPDTGQRYHVLF